MITYSDVQVYPQDYYARESKLLFSMIPDTLLDLFKECNLFLAGGAITSLFTSGSLSLTEIQEFV